MPWRKTYGAEACTLQGSAEGLRLRRDRRRPAVPGAAPALDLAGELLRVRARPVAGSPVQRAAVRRRGDRLREPLGDRGVLRRVHHAWTVPIELVERSAVDHLTLEEEVSLRSSTQCPYRPGHVFVDDTCVADPTFASAGGGVVMIGDSLTWRGSDELGRLRPTFTLDGEPARPPTELASRLAFFRSGHGEPDGLIIELGTVPAKSVRPRRPGRTWSGACRARRRSCWSCPTTSSTATRVVVTPQSKRVDGWMRDLAQLAEALLRRRLAGVRALAPGDPPGRRAHQARRRGSVGALDLPAVGRLLSQVRTATTGRISGPVVGRTAPFLGDRRRAPPRTPTVERVEGAGVDSGSGDHPRGHSSCRSHVRTPCGDASQCSCSGCCAVVGSRGGAARLQRRAGDRNRGGRRRDQLRPGAAGG